ncbi:hypothetical protein LZ554_000256 [Drepanopeziza brunnea f. sp. 'monogermtubi']|nr:hypothetical protein LZ554_000256 [Drepanopeziza brunnea f. sp. 'monogermtubi']
MPSHYSIITFDLRSRGFRIRPNAIPGGACRILTHPHRLFAAATGAGEITAQNFPSTLTDPAALTQPQPNHTHRRPLNSHCRPFPVPTASSFAALSASAWSCAVLRCAHQHYSTYHDNDKKLSPLSRPSQTDSCLAFPLESYRCHRSLAGLVQNSG